MNIFKRIRIISRIQIVYTKAIDLPYNTESYDKFENCILIFGRDRNWSS